MPVEAGAVDFGRARVRGAGAVRSGEGGFEHFAVVAEDAGAVGHDEHVAAGDVAVQVALVVQEFEAFHGPAEEGHDVAEVVFVEVDLGEVAAGCEGGDEVENVRDALAGAEGCCDVSGMTDSDTATVGA